MKKLYVLLSLVLLTSCAPLQSTPMPQEQANIDAERQAAKETKYYRVTMFSDGQVVKSWGHLSFYARLDAGSCSFQDSLGKSVLIVAPFLLEEE